MTRRVAMLGAVLAMLCGGAVAAASAGAGSRASAAEADTAKRASTACGTSSPAGATCRRPVASSVGAGAYDFGSFVLRLTRTAVPAGNLTIYFHNYDVGYHNLWIAPRRGSARRAVRVSEAVGEHDGATTTVRVTHGTWRLYCSMNGHEAMTRDLAVQ